MPTQKFRNFGLLLSVLLMAGCGSQAAGGNTQDEPEPLPSLTRQDAQALDALEPPDTEGVRAAPRATSSVSSLTTPRPCEDLNKWLGSALPELPSLEKEGYTRLCGTDHSGALKPAGSLDDNGEPYEVNLFQFYVPDGVDLSRASFADAREQGVYIIAVYSGPNIFAPPVLESDPDQTAGGYVTLKFPEGPIVGVQNQGTVGTRIAWPESSNAGKVNVTVMSPETPRKSYQVAVRDDLATS